MKISCASNLDNNFIKNISDSKIIKTSDLEFFFSYPKSKFSLNRYLNPDISKKDFDKHISLILQSGYKINYLLNSLEIKDLEKLKFEIKSLIDLGINTFTISDVNLIKFLNKEFPNIDIVLSIIYGLKNTEELNYLLKNYKIKRVIFDQSLNHDFKKIFQLLKICKLNNIETEILVNELCFSDCKYRKEHYQLDSRYDNNDFNIKSKLGDYCNTKRNMNTIIFDSPWIRPEDVFLYEKIGIDYIKISGRNTGTNILFNTLKSYINKDFNGNFFDLMDLDGKRDDNSGRKETRFLKNKKLNGYIISKNK